MSDENNNNITEHPNTLLRRKMTTLENQVKALEKQREDRARIDLIIIEKYEEMRGLVTRLLALVADMNAKINKS